MKEVLFREHPAILPAVIAILPGAKRKRGIVLISKFG